MNCEPTSRRPNAFTLIELMVVIVIIGVLTAMIIPEMKGSFQDALLRSTSRELVDVFDLTYSRAISLNQQRRVLLDEKTGRYLVEKRVSENGQENFVPANDMPNGKGELDSRIAVTLHLAGENQDANAAPAQGLPADDESASGKVALTFYPDGTATAAEILLRDRQGFKLILRLNPITARVHIIEPESEARE
ncbi:MAG TPA: prepilin-type N-terminal cleavage/methylation domain-containing protein [Verrucomicrobiae bacterium]|jgi:prepilin-type N-terminal cleavage/methylation domain-containing protein